MIIIGIGTGGIKSNVSALIVEQYTNTKRYIKVLKNGERVIVDPTVTIQRMYTWFYWAINIGGLSSLATTQLEARVGFWAAYLLPFCVFFLAIFVLIAGRKHYVTRPPRGSVILSAFKVLWIGLRNRCNLEAAKPSYQKEFGNKHKTQWNDLFVDEIRRALVACRIFLFFPIYWVCYNQMLNNLISQAGEMERHGIPNDFLQNIDPLALIIFIPIMDLGVYPGLRKIGIKFRPITRIYFGFMFAAGAMAYTAGIQVPFIPTLLMINADFVSSTGFTPLHHATISPPALPTALLTSAFKSRHMSSSPSLKFSPPSVVSNTPTPKLLPR